MLHARFVMISIIGIVAVTSCFGFIVERTVDVPATWNMAPSLETEQKAPIDHILNGKMQVTGECKCMEKVLQAFDTNKSAKQVEQANPEKMAREKRSDVISENVEGEAKLVKNVKDLGINPIEESITTDSAISGPRNVILLLIGESADRDVWKDFKATHSYPIEGFLQNCGNSDLDSMRISLDDSLVSGSKDKECECEHFLRLNVAALLSWARHDREMTTGAVTGANFTISSPLGYDGPLREFEEFDENGLKPEVEKSKPDTRGGWHLIDLGKPTSHAASVVIAPNGNEDQTNENMWDVFSRIRIAFFRALVDSLGGNAATDAISRKSRTSRSNLPELLTNTIKELKSVPNEKGYMLVAAVTGNELASAVELVQREISPKDTMVVVAGVCSHNSKPIPFFAEGPNTKMLEEATTIWGLPTVIRNAVTAGCHGCRVRRHDLPFPFASERTNSQDIARKRLPRDNKETVENTTNDSKTENDASGKIEAGSDGNSTMEMRDSMATRVTTEVKTTVLGIILSIVAMVTLTIP